MLGSIKDWPGIYREAFRCLKPGGFVEHFEHAAKIESDNGAVHPDSDVELWGKMFSEGGIKSGRTFNIVEDGIQEKYTKEAGFVEVVVQDMKVRESPGCRSHQKQIRNGPPRGAKLLCTKMRVSLMKCPIGEWPEDAEQKLIGAFARAVLMEDLSGMLFPFVRNCYISCSLGTIGLG